MLKRSLTWAREIALWVKCEDLSSLPSTASGECGVHDGMYMQSQRRESRDMISISGASLASLLQGIGEFQACVCARMHTDTQTSTHIQGTPYLGSLIKRLKCLGVEGDMEMERQEASGEAGSPVGRNYYQRTCGTKVLQSEHRPLRDV